MGLDEKRATIGENITRARIKKKWSQRKLAEKLSFSHTKLSAIERGEATASRSDLYEIAAALVVPVTSLEASSQHRQELFEYVETCILNEEDLVEALNVLNDLMISAIPGQERANIRYLEGKALYLLGKYKKSSDFYLEALGEYERVRDERKIFSCNANLALCGYKLRDYGRAIYYADQAVIYATEIESAQMQQLKANVLVDMQELDSALEIHKNLLEFFETKEIFRSVVQTRQNIGDIYLKKSDHPAAQNQFEIAVRMAYEIAIPEEVSRTSIELAKVLSAQGKLELALKTLESALDYCESKIKPPQKARLLYYLSNAIQSNEEKLSLLKQSFEICEKIDEFDLLRAVSRSLGELYEDYDDLQGAVLYYKIASRLEDDRIF